MAQKKFLDALENRLNEIEQCQDTESDLSLKNQPGAFRVSPDTINQLHTELNTLSNGIKNILNRIGYPIDTHHQEDAESDDKITQCIQYCVYLNHLIASHHDDLAKHVGGQTEEEMDLLELQRKQRKLAEKSKRSSSKVAKSYLNLQHNIEQNEVSNNNNKKQQLKHHEPIMMMTRSRNSSGHRRGKSHEFLSDDTSTVSGMSDVERKLAV